MSTTNKLISILKKEDKSQDDILFLKVYLSKNKFFQQVFESFKGSPEINNEICRAVKYQTYPKFSIIFKQGDTNCDKAYIILKGKIMIFMKNTIDVFQKEGDTDENQQIELTTKKWVVEQLLESQLEENDEAARNEVPEQDFLAVLAQQYGKLLIEVEEGALFGEKALIENKPRAATICSKTPCEFLILNKEDFEIVQIKYNKAQQDKKDFIMNKFPFLGNLITSGRVFERVVRFFDEETYHKNQIIVKEGVQIPHTDQKLFVIVQGEIQLYKNIMKKVNNPHSLIDHQIEQIHIATLGQQEIFGEELLENTGEDKFYIYTAVCVSPNSQFLTINMNVLEKKMPDQMKEFIQANYFSKKQLRENILQAHDKQKKELEIMRKKNMKDKYEFEKNLLIKILKNKEEIIQQNENNKQEFKDKISIQESPSKKNQISFKFSKRNSLEENYGEQSNNQIQSKQLISQSKSEGKQQILQYSQTEILQKQAKLSKLNEQGLQSKKKDSFRTQKSIDSDAMHELYEKQQVIRGDSNKQNMVLFHQLRSDVNEKVKKEGGFKKDINFGYFYESEMQNSEVQQKQMEIKKCNPYPFKLIANNKHLKQLETRLKQKKFQFADAQGILSKTKYYQAKEKNELSLKQMIEEGLTKSKFYQDDEPKQNKNKEPLQNMSKQLSFSQMLKRSIEKEKEENDESDQQIIKKNVGISNLFKDDIQISEYGNKIENTGRNLYACSHQIKLHSILKKVSDNYQSHPEYYEESENLAQIIKLSKNNSEQQYKFYQISQAKQNAVETRKILSRSPVIRKLKIVQYSARHGGGVSIPSNKRHIIENNPNQQSKIRPSSDETRYNKNNSSFNQVSKYLYRKDSFVVQSSAQSYTKNDTNKSSSPKNLNNSSFKTNKLSVKYLQLQQKLPNNNLTIQDVFQVEGNISQGVQRLHSSQKHRAIKNTPTNQKLKENSKQSEFSFFTTINQGIDLNISKESINQNKVILMQSNSFCNNQSNKEEQMSPQKQQDQENIIENNQDITFSQNYPEQSESKQQQSNQPAENQLQIKQDEQIQLDDNIKDSSNIDDSIKQKKSIENISEPNSNLQKIKSQNSLQKNDTQIDQLVKSKEVDEDNSSLDKQNNLQIRQQIDGKLDDEQLQDKQQKYQDQFEDNITIEKIGSIIANENLISNQDKEIKESYFLNKINSNNSISSRNSKILNQVQSQSQIGNNAEQKTQIDQQILNKKQSSFKFGSKKNSLKNLASSIEAKGLSYEQKDQETDNNNSDNHQNQKLNTLQIGNHELKENSSSVELTSKSLKSEQSITNQSKQIVHDQQKDSKKKSIKSIQKKSNKQISKEDKPKTSASKIKSEIDLKNEETS